MEGIFVKKSKLLALDISMVLMLSLFSACSKNDSGGTVTSNDFVVKTYY